MTDDSLSRLAERRGVETQVYQPAEDSGLLATVAAEHLNNPDLVLEVGTGSGWVAATIGEETGARVIGSDVNPYACRQASDRGVEAVRGNLLDPFADGVFDAVLFNPPYLPTDPDEEWDDWMEVALSGGADGRAVIEPFLETVSRVLAPDGIVLMLVSTLTGIEEIVSLADDAGFASVAVHDESFPFETLTVLKLVR